MASKLIPGAGTYLEDFATGQGGGGTNYFNYGSDFDINFLAIRNATNALIDEMRGVQGTNAVIPLDLVLLDDPLGFGATTNVLIGANSYLATFISISQVDVKLGVCVLGSIRQSASNPVALGPVVGTDDTGTDYAYIALDINGTISINTAPGSQVLDVWRVEVNGAGTEFVDNIQKVGTWQYAPDGDAWVALSDATGLGGTDTFPIEPAGVPTGRPYPEPSVRVNRVERLLSGFVTDLQATPQTIGPIVIPGGAAATPGLVLGDGTGTNSLTSGFFRIGADRLGYSAAGVLAVEVDAAGQLDLPLNFRVKGERTAAQTIADGGSLVDLDFTATDLFDIGAWHDPGGGSPEAFTVPTDGGGTYVITAGIEWAEAITNIRDVTAEIQLGGTLIPGGLASARLEVGEDHASTIHVVAVLAATNVIRVQVSQDDTVGALGLDVLGATLSIVKVA